MSSPLVWPPAERDVQLRTAWAGGFRKLLVLSAALILWGPPALRKEWRDLDAALVNPLSMDSAAALQVGAWVLAGGLAAILLVRYVERGSPVLSSLLLDRPLRLYVFYGLVGVASVAWSGSPLYTLFFSAKIIIGVTVLASVAAWSGPRRLLGVLFVVFSLQALAIAYYLLADPDVVTAVAPDGSVGRVTGGMFGDFGSSGLLGGLYFLTLALFGRSPGRRVVGVVGYVGSWVLVILAQTRTVMAAGVLFFALMAILHPRLRNKVPILVAMGVLALAGFFPQALESVETTATRSGEGLETLSGRTVAFAYLAERWEQSPIIGYGFAAGTRSQLVDFVKESGLNMGAGHDVLSSVLVDLGVIGLITLAAALLASWRAFGRLWRRVSWSSHDRITLHQVGCLLTFITLMCISAPSIAAPSMEFVVAMVGLWALRSAGRFGTASMPDRRHSENDAGGRSGRGI